MLDLLIRVFLFNSFLWVGIANSEIGPETGVYEKRTVTNNCPAIIFPGEKNRAEEVFSNGSLPEVDEISVQGMNINRVHKPQSFLVISSSGGQAENDPFGGRQGQSEFEKIRAYKNRGEPGRASRLLDSLMKQIDLAGLPIDIQVFYLDQILEQRKYFAFEKIFKKYYSGKEKIADRELYRWGRELIRKQKNALALRALSEIGAASEFSPRKLYLQALMQIQSGDLPGGLLLLAKCRQAAQKTQEEDLVNLSLLSQARIRLFQGNIEEAGLDFQAIPPESHYYPEAQYELVLLRFQEKNYYQCWRISTRLAFQYPDAEDNSKYWLAQAYSLLGMNDLEGAAYVFRALKSQHLALKNEVQTLIRFSSLEPGGSGSGQRSRALKLIKNSQMEMKDDYEQIGLGKKIVELKHLFERTKYTFSATKKEIVDLTPYRELFKKAGVQIESAESRLKDIEFRAQQARERLWLARLGAKLEAEKEIFFRSLVAMADISFRQQEDIKAQIRKFNRSRGQEIEEVRKIIDEFREKMPPTGSETRKKGEKKPDQEEAKEYYQMRMEKISEQLKEMGEQVHFLQEFLK